MSKSNIETRSRNRNRERKREITGIMAAGEVVGSIFFAANKLLWMEKLAVCSGPHLVNDRGLQINEDGTWNVLSSAGFAEEGVEGVVSAADGFVTRHLSIGLRNGNKNLH